MQVLSETEIEIVAGGMNMTGIPESTNFIDATTPQSYQTYLNGQVAAGNMTQYQADLLMGRYLSYKLAVQLGNA